MKFQVQIINLIAWTWPKFFENHWKNGLEGIECFWVLLWFAGVVAAGLLLCYIEDPIHKDRFL